MDFSALRLLAVVLCTLSTTPVTAEPGGTQADYERAASLRKAYDSSTYQLRLEPHWLSSTQFWYRAEARDGHSFVLIETSDGTRSPAFDHDKVAESLAKASDKAVEASKLPFNHFDFRLERTAIQFRAFDKRWQVNLDTNECIERGQQSKQKEERNDRRRRSSGQEVPSPDGKWIAYLRQHNVYVRSSSDGEEIQLSNDGEEDHAYELPIHWAPDSKRVALWKTKRGKERLVHYIDSAPDEQLQPKHFTRTYAKPGDEIDTRSPHIYTADWTSKHIHGDASQFPNPFVMRKLEWTKDSQAITFEYIERGFGVHRLLEINAQSGVTRAIIDERSETFVDAFQKGYRHDLTESNEILWASERDGWNHLYLIDSKSGDVKNQITQGAWVMRGVDHVDATARHLIFRASGFYPDQDPYFIHYFRVNFDGSGLVPLTEADGNHSAHFSPDRQKVVVTHSGVDSPPIHELRSAIDGTLICELGQADIEELEAKGWRAPEVFVSKDRDGGFDIWGVIIRPSNFDPKQSYPVIEHIYAGPHSAFVPKSFRPFYRMQEMAELGFIVVKMDGKGTSHRSREFHHFCHKNLGDSGFPDRIAWMRAAANKYPEMDISRVGIYGGSAGGQSALRALLAHGDFYKAAAADCGCHDNRMDKIWWNELWMDWPIGPHYDEQSNVTNAHKLQGKLLLTVGELDTNVDPASTLQVVDALIKADKDFEFLLVPGASHGVGESPYAARRRKDFFVRHLLEVEPRR